MDGTLSFSEICLATLGERWRRLRVARYAHRWCARRRNPPRCHNSHRVSAEGDSSISSRSDFIREADFIHEVDFITEGDFTAAGFAPRHPERRMRSIRSRTFAG